MAELAAEFPVPVEYLRAILLEALLITSGAWDMNSLMQQALLHGAQTI